MFHIHIDKEYAPIWKDHMHIRIYIKPHSHIRSQKIITRKRKGIYLNPKNRITTEDMNKNKNKKNKHKKIAKINNYT